jgi:hypothetical protein
VHCVYYGSYAVRAGNAADVALRPAGVSREGGARAPH